MAWFYILKICKTVTSDTNNLSLYLTNVVISVRFRIKFYVHLYFLDNLTNRAIGSLTPIYILVRISNIRLDPKLGLLTGKEPVVLPTAYIYCDIWRWCIGISVYLHINLFFITYFKNLDTLSGAPLPHMITSLY